MNSVAEATYPTKEDMDNLCLAGHGENTCRYLTIGVKGPSCEKHSDLGPFLDRRVQAGLMEAKGDNCPGKDSR